MANIIPEGWSVPERVRQRVGKEAGKQRAICEEGHLLLIVYDVPQADESARSAKLFWRDREGAWRSPPSGDMNALPALRRVIEAYHQCIAELDRRVDSGKSAQDFFHVLNHANPVSRAARNLARAMQEARDHVDDREVIALRDTTHELERSAELVVTDAQNALNFTIARNAESQAALGQKALDAQHRLNLLAALFFPVTAVGSILGMNLPTGLERAHPALYWAILMAAFASGFVLRGSLSR
ncbi:MAG: hypothetical protein JNK72_24045 [Myxococcales bacterium]|nr:hypothetical protein [Myxococcales bacterium]